MVNMVVMHNIDTLREEHEFLYVSSLYSGTTFF